MPLQALTIALAFAAIFTGCTLYARDYERALAQCEHIHSRSTCIHILR